MKNTKDQHKKNKIQNNNKGITIISLLITVAIMLIISSTAIYTSMDRFEINKLNKMYNDINLLSDKVANYYLKYGELPVIKNNEYTYTNLNFSKNKNDNDKYYIINLSAMDNISLNYGMEGFEKQGKSDDVYIINELSHAVYYVKGIEVNGVIYNTVDLDKNVINDNIPPTKPEIKIITGSKNEAGNYVSKVEFEIIPGKDNWSGVNRTTYSIYSNDNTNNNVTEKDIATLENNICTIKDAGTYQIKVKSYDNNGNSSENSLNIKIVKNDQSVDVS